MPLNGKNQKTNIVMLPAHMMFFELFSNIKIHTIDNVLSVLNENLSVYPIKFIDNIISSFIMADLIEKVGGCYTLNEEYTGKDNINLINEQIDIYRSITREEIQSVAQKYLSPNQRVEIEYLPGDEVGEE